MICLCWNAIDKALRALLSGILLVIVLTGGGGGAAAAAINV